MKGLFFKSLMLLLLLALINGCSDDSNVIAPDAETTAANSEYEFVSFQELFGAPLEKGNWKDLFVSNTETVYNATGGRVSLRIRNLWGNGNRIEAQINIPQGALQDEDESIDITMKHYFLDWTLYFEPHPYLFKKDLTLDLKFTGICLGEEFIKDLKFAYLSYDGKTIEICESGKIDYNPYTKVLHVRQAKIPHFSRYGWLR